MYNDLADAVESFKEKGYTNIFGLEDECIVCKSLEKEFTPDDLTIVESYSFDQGTDPGSESSVHAITTESGIKGLLIISFGIYVDPAKAKIVDLLLNSSK